MNHGALVLGVAVALSAATCTRPPALAHSYDTPDALAIAVVEALAARDRERLEAIALSEREFRDHVWPELPAARPERNLPFSFVWGDLRQKSLAALSRTLNEHGGRRYHVDHVSFAARTQYASYTIHRDATVHVRDDAETTRELRVCGSMLEQQGRWKVFSYVIDD
jgi:hypothetical protein